MLWDSEKRVVFEGMCFQAAMGSIDGLQVHHIVGYNPSLTLATIEETIWDTGGVYQWIDIPSQLSIVSDNVNDDWGGSGAQSVRLYGLNSDWDMITEDVQLNGTTPVSTAQTYQRIHQMTIPAIEGGGAKDAIGTIAAKIGATVHAQIINGNNQTLMALFTVPRNYTGFIIYGNACVGKSKEVFVKFRTRDYEGVFTLDCPVFIFESTFDKRFEVPHRINEKSDIVMSAYATADDTEVSGGFDILLVRNS